MVGVNGSGELFDGAFAPFTNCIWFINADYAATVSAVRDWRTGLETSVLFGSLSGDLASLLGALEPWAMPSWKQLIVQTASPWTALFSQGSDIHTFDVVCRVLRCRAIRTHHQLHVVRAGEVISYGDTALRLTDGSRDDLAPLCVVRTIQASNQDGWLWCLDGEVQPFEDLGRYGKRLIKDRFDLEVLNRYCQALGIERAETGYYGPSATLLTQDTSAWPGRRRTMSSRDWRATYS